MEKVDVEKRLKKTLQVKGLPLESKNLWSNCN